MPYYPAHKQKYAYKYIRIPYILNPRAAHPSEDVAAKKFARNNQKKLKSYKQ